VQDATKYIANGPVASYGTYGYGLWLIKRIEDDAPIVLSVPVIAAITTDDNVPSLRLLFKLGFDFIGMISPPQQDEELMLLEKR
jgi:hypothetical protein